LLLYEGLPCFFWHSFWTILALSRSGFLLSCGPGHGFFPLPPCSGCFSPFSKDVSSEIATAAPPGAFPTNALSLGGRCFFLGEFKVSRLRFVSLPRQRILRVGDFASGPRGLVCGAVSRGRVLFTPSDSGLFGVIFGPMHRSVFFKDVSAGLLVFAGSWQSFFVL
jgi:hypothetical protein